MKSMNSKKDSIVSVICLGIAMVIGACGGSTSNLSSQDSSSTQGPCAQDELERHEQALRTGDLESAKIGFTDCHERALKPGNALGGLLAIAEAAGDYETIETLVQEFDLDQATNRLVVQAAEAARRLPLITERALEIMRKTCTLEPGEEFKKKATEICAVHALRSQYQEVSKCVAACEKKSTIPFFFSANIPIVQVRINGGDEVAFILDSGAASSVITKQYADAISVSPVPGSEFTADAAGGEIPTTWAVVNMSIGQMEIENIPTAIIDLPIENIAGILSPDTAFPGKTVELNYQTQNLVIYPEGTFSDDQALLTFPLVRALGNPAIMLTIGDRAPLPIVIDSGASHTTLFTAIGEVEEYQKNSIEAVSVGAGGTENSIWKYNGEIPVSGEALEWNLTRAHIIEKKTDDFKHGMHYYGLLGADFLMGRRLIFDTKNQKMKISTHSILAPWNVEESAVFEVFSKGDKKPIKVIEKVKRKGDNKITLEVEIAHPKTPERFLIEMQDTWANRGTWLITRPTEKYWKIIEGKEEPGDPKESIQKWLLVFKPFKSTGANPKMSFKKKEYAGKKIPCTEIQVDAEMASQPSKLIIEECPILPWRVVRVAVTTEDKKEILWEIKRK